MNNAEQVAYDAGKRKYRLKSGVHSAKTDDGRVKLNAGGTIWMFPDKAAGFKNRFEDVTPDGKDSINRPEEVLGEFDKVAFELVIKDRGFGNFDVVRTDTEDVLNDKPLTEDEAKEFMNAQGFDPDKKAEKKKAVKKKTAKKKTAKKKTPVKKKEGE